MDGYLDDGLVAKNYGLFSNSGWSAAVSKTSRSTPRYSTVFRAIHALRLAYGHRTLRKWILKKHPSARPTNPIIHLSKYPTIPSLTSATMKPVRRCAR
jgi:hypothetical protein